MTVTLQPIEPGSQRVKGTDLLLLRNYHGEWQLCHRKVGTEPIEYFANLADARSWLNETNAGCRLVRASTVPLLRARSQHQSPHQPRRGRCLNGW